MLPRLKLPTSLAGVVAELRPVSPPCRFQGSVSWWRSLPGESATGRCADAAGRGPSRLTGPVRIFAPARWDLDERGVTVEGGGDVRRGHHGGGSMTRCSAGPASACTRRLGGAGRRCAVRRICPG